MPDSTLPALETGRAGRAVAAAHVLLLSAALAPLFLVDVPALVDYPNHLARMRILADLDAVPALRAIYAANWSVVPNLAMDLVVPPLAGLLGVIAAGKIFIGATLVVLVAGTVALHRVLHGSLGAGSLLVYLVLFNYVLAFGFLNYLFGIGLSLLLFAVWIGSGGWAPWRRLAVGTLGALVLFFSHLAAAAAYGLYVAAYELWLWQGEHPRRPAALLRRALFAGAQFLPALGLFFFASPTARGDLEISYILQQKIVLPFVPTLFYAQPSDFLLSSVLIGVVCFAWLRGRLSLRPAMIFPVFGLAGAALLMPTWILGNWGNDFRLMVPLVLLLAAGCRIRGGGRTALIAVGVVAVALFGFRVGTLARDWRAYDRLYGELRAAARHLEPGARVLPAADDWSLTGEVAPNGYRRTFLHAPALLALERPVFLPGLFTAEGRQPLTVQPAYAAIDVPYAKPMPLDTLVLAAAPDSAGRLPLFVGGGEFYDRFAGWPETFDYVLMLDFGAPRNPLPDLLAPTARGSYFTLYAIGRETQPPGE